MSWRCRRRPCPRRHRPCRDRGAGSSSRPSFISPKRASGMSTWNRLPRKRETSMTPTYQETTATGTPTSRVRPMSASSASAAATGPGCGGTRACIAANAPAAGSAVEQQRAAEPAGDGQDDRQEHHQPGVEEDREAEEQRGDAEGQRRPLLAEPVDEGVRQDLRAAGHLEQAADHDAEADQQRHGADGVGEAVDQGVGHVADRDAGRDGGDHADQHQGDEGVQPHLHDQEEQEGHGNRGDDHQGGGAVRRCDCFHVSSESPRGRVRICPDHCRGHVAASASGEASGVP